MVNHHKLASAEFDSSTQVWYFDKHFVKILPALKINILFENGKKSIKNLRTITVTKW